MNSRELLASSARLSHELLTVIHDEPTSVDRIAVGLVDAASPLFDDHDVVVTVLVDRSREAQAGSTRAVRELSAFEARLGAGPTRCAIDEVRPVRTGDGRFLPPDPWVDAVARAGYPEVLAVPIVIAGAAAGAVTVYARRGIEAERDVDVAELVAHQAALVLEGGRRLVQLRDAVASRDVIGQAKGILMHRFGIDAPTAFSRLVEASQDMNVKLVDIARWYVTDQDGTAPTPRP